jgi:predicted RND superfamily exporter protein
MFSKIHLMKLSKEIWTFLLLSFLSVIFLANFVNLQPHVDENFFFSNTDLQFQSEHLISRLFIRKDTQIIISATGKIDSAEYMAKTKQLSDALLMLQGVIGIKSASHGPQNIEDAMSSPLWKRLLISNDKRSTNFIVIVDDTMAQQTVWQIESIVGKFSSADFKINVSGLPYVIELIRRNLLKDLKIFSALAFIIFSLVVYIIFKSKAIVGGMMISCLNACMWTFMITGLCQIPIGLLTANLATIIFVMTLSHTIFLTYNWKNSRHLDQTSSVDKAMRVTFSASFWSMFTTLLGFLSLFFVPARPLKELGVAGSIGTLIAMITAYGIYPSFLKLAKPTSSEADFSKNRIYAFLEKEKKSIRVLVLFFCVFSLPGLWKINTDPSLLSFFSKNTELYKGLEYIDRNGGSSPLVLIVRSSDGATLNSQAAYEKLWKLQESLEQHQAIGSVISLPVLMAQAKQAPLAMFLAWDWLLNILEKPEYDNIAKSFVTEDRKFGLFLLRMNELNRVEPRLTIVEEIKAIVKTNGFTSEISGGIYILQGHLAKLVVSSLISGLIQLMFLFTLILWFVSRSIRITIAVILSISLLPFGILGVIGLYGIPLDVISSPASNVAIAMGIDSMIHMLQAFRRRRNLGEKDSRAIWQLVREELYQPIVTAAMVVSTGFSIFLFSTFPPTQRFGLAIVFGTILSTLTALYIMPALVQLGIKPLSPISRP